ncbi:MAG TPA: hypothetical protein PKV16_08465 [Caldisericia bacterium]|nr:hypothetical protein [Caldisericia bacterium]HPF49365.1 hypothetical protein [Caldisericia bacterium]HPI84441.1 hypothetical protein [Caldisericia bacterium]HPQ93798.1 hypothetical protein [Caldisericia bacterium]HRV75638.1 hypothetical protein [Caldisericia bacterium]
MNIKIDFGDRKIVWKPDTTLRSLYYQGKPSIMFYSNTDKEEEYVKFHDEKTRNRELRRVEKILNDNGISKDGFNNNA